jgi:hypothetical protein
MQPIKMAFIRADAIVETDRALGSSTSTTAYSRTHMESAPVPPIHSGVNVASVPLFLERARPLLDAALDGGEIRTVYPAPY